MKPARNFKVLYFCLFLLIAFQAKGKDSLDNVVISDLRSDWLVYNKEYKSYFPLSGKKENLISATQVIDLNKYTSYNLNFVADPGLSLFVNSKLVYRNNTPEQKKVIIKIDTLEKTGGNEKEVITFFNSSRQLPLNTIFIGNSAPHHIESANNLHFPVARNIEASNTLYILVFLAILTVIAILRNRYPKKFYALFRFSNILPDNDENAVMDVTSVPVFLFILINSFCAALILFVIKKEYDLNSLQFLNILNTKSVLGILMVSGVLCVIYLIKYLQLKIIGWIFNLKELVKFQFFELMKVSLKINLFLTVLILIFHSSGYFNFGIDFNYFFYFIILSLLIVLLRVGYLTFTLSGFRNIYLFSYLCTTEILPLIIIIKLILF